MRSTTCVVAALALGCLTSVAHADRARSLKIYNQGKARYTSGDFTGAIERFEAAYKEHPSPAYLFNIAQAYRELDDCKQALTYYKRFAAEKPDASSQVEPQIAELAPRCGHELEPDAPETTVPEASALADPDPAEETTAAPIEKPQPTVVEQVAPDTRTLPLIVASAELGTRVFKVSDDVVVPATFAVLLGAGHPFALGPVELEVGGSVQLIPLAYTHAMGDSTAVWTSISATATALYPVTSKIRVGGGLAAGVVMLSGFKAGNPFSDAQEETNLLTMPTVRTSALAELSVAEGIAATVSGAFSYTAAPEEFRDPIRLIGLDALLGARYRW